MMEKIVEQSLLYDFYGELLTPHQKEIYEAAVFNDLSLSEIAEEQGISRQGVHDQLKRCHKILEDYEAKLGMLKRFLQIKQKVEEISQVAQEAGEQTAHSTEGDCVQLAEAFGHIRQLAGDILEEL